MLDRMLRVSAAMSNAVELNAVSIVFGPTEKALCPAME